MWHMVAGTGKHCNMYSGLQYKLISNTNLLNLYFVQFCFEWLTSGHLVGTQCALSGHSIPTRRLLSIATRYR